MHTSRPMSGFAARRLASTRPMQASNLSLWRRSFVVSGARAQRSRPRQDRRRLYALAEVPFFVDSHLTRLMQLADLVAYAFYRGYSASDWAWSESAIGGFADPNRLLHFTNDTSCECPACSQGVETLKN